MAKLASKITLGIDVAKVEVVIFNWAERALLSVHNTREEIRSYLRGLHGPVRIAIEPTAHYHFTFIEEAQALGFEIYLVNPRQLAHYREAVNVRHKTDPQDAFLLARYLVHEADQLRAFEPRDRRAQRLWALMTRRATVVRSRQQMQQSFRATGVSIAALVTQFNRLLQRLEVLIQRLIRELGWWNDYLRCSSIPGVGPATAAGLVVAHHRAAFASSDSFVAYLGLDIRIRESGSFKGKRKLTKRGEPELRRLLYCASQGALSHPPFKAYRQAQINKGHSKIAARVALARKLVRIAFALMTNKQSFQHPANNLCRAP